MWRPLHRRRRTSDAEFASEIAGHIAIETDRLIAEGWPAADAGHEARKRFGNVTAAHERHHESRTTPLLESLAQDARYAVRALLRTPAFTTIAVLSLALGIGANTAAFTFVNAVLFKKLPVREPDRLVWVRTDPRFPTLDYPTVTRFRERPDLFAGVAAVYALDRANVEINRQADQRGARVHLVTGDYFPMLGVHAAIGRTFTMEDERAPGAHPVAVVSNAYWRSHFPPRTDPLGSTITFNGTTYSVIGVTPASFTGDELAQPADLWIPIMMQSQVMTERPGILMTSRSWVRMLARLKPGATNAQTAAAATQFFQQLLVAGTGERAPVAPLDAATERVTLNPESRGYGPSRDDVAEPMILVWGIVGLVLAIACVNVSLLLLVRAAGREREIMTRLALGASAGRVASLLLTEGALIGGAASVLGMIVAIAGIRGLARVAASGMTSYQLSTSPDMRVLALTLGVSLITMLVCGLIPARRAARVSVTAAGAGLSAGRGVISRAPLGRLLVVTQVALALVLVIGAGLFARTLRTLEQQDPGFDRDHVLEAFTSPEQANISGDRLANLYDAAAARISALPGVRDVVVSTRGLLTQYSGMVRTTVPGYVRKPDEMEFVAFNVTMPGFFRTAGMTLLAGRDFSSSDLSDHPRVALVSASMARHYYGTVNAIGKRFGIARDEGAPIEIIGIVPDAKDASLRDANIDMMYLPYRQNVHSLNQMRIVVRTSGSPAALAAPVRRVLNELEPTLPVTAVEPVRAQMSRMVATESLTAIASGFFGAIAVLLAALGLFAMVSHAVVTRTSEIGIRMALGGTSASVMRMILRENAALVGAGLIAGTVAAVFAARAVSSRLFGIAPTDAPTFVAAVTLMLLTALVAVLVPALRATRVDPAITLRHD